MLAEEEEELALTMVCVCVAGWVGVEEGMGSRAGCCCAG
jgi:hypothetical protein